MAFDLADVFEAVARAVPGRPALVAAGDRPPSRLTYGELADRTARLAHVLRRRGIEPGHRVGILLSNGARHMEVLLACLRAGAVPVNVNPRLVAGELRGLLTASRVRLLVTAGDGESAAARLPPGVPELGILTDDWEDDLAAAPEAPLPARPPDGTYVLYTGGTTGRPKGVLWRQHDLYFAALVSASNDPPPPRSPAEAAERAAGTAAPRCLVACSLSHGTGQWMALRTLLGGGTLLLRADRHLRPDEVWRTAAAEEAAWLVVVGDAVARPLVAALRDLRAVGDEPALGNLTVIASGGAVLSSGVAQELLHHLPTVIVVDGFGASETGGQGRRLLLAGAPAAPAGHFRVGDDTAVLGDDLRPLAPGDPQTGRLARTGTIPLGYDDDPEATAAAFPVVDGTRWALTGDWARIAPDGTIAVLGRGATTITSGGEKVHAEEVEWVLREHPSVSDAVVVGVHDPRWGQRVTAIVEPQPGCHPTLDHLARHCRSSLAAHKIPRGLVLVDEVVRRESGKPDYRWARDVAAAAEPGPGNPGQSSS